MRQRILNKCSYEIGDKMVMKDAVYGSEGSARCECEAIVSNLDSMTAFLVCLLIILFSFADKSGSSLTAAEVLACLH